MSYASRLSDEVYPETYLVIEGSKGSVELGKRKHLLVTTGAGTTQSTVTPQSYPWMDPKYDLVHSSIVDCNRALLNGLKDMSRAETSGADNLNTVRLVFGSYEAAAKDVVLRFGSKGKRGSR
jgi:predicted dehydrogenase